GLAAGHRPCFECRRKSYNAYADAWATGNAGVLGPGRPTAASMDERLNAERIGPGRSKRTFRATLSELPDGVFVTRSEGERRAYLIWEGKLLAGSPGGYERSHAPQGGEEVSVLTPRSSVDAIRAGYVPGVHPSANGP